jgi:hypothetical protein
VEELDRADKANKENATKLAQDAAKYKVCGQPRRPPPQPQQLHAALRHHLPGCRPSVLPAHACVHAGGSGAQC